MRIVIALLSISISPPLVAASFSKALSKKDMDGQIIRSERKTTLLTKGDKVELSVNRDEVMHGDRMTIYKPASGSSKPSAILTPQGTVIITAIYGGHVLGIIDSVKREISPGDFVRHQLHPQISKSRYFNFLKRVVSERLHHPAREKLSIAVTEIADENGNVTVLTSRLFEELTSAICARPQFNCLSKRELTDYLSSEYSIKTSYGMGSVVRKKIAKHFDLHLLFTAKAVTKGEKISILTTSWDMIGNLKTPEVILTASTSDFPDIRNYPFRILKKKSKMTYGSLKISLNVDAKISGRRVDHLFIENISDYTYKKYEGRLRQNLYGKMELGNLSVLVNGKTYFLDEKNIIFDDLMLGKEQAVTITASPILKGEIGLIVGKPIEKKIKIDIPPNGSIHMEIFLKTDENRAIMGVDSNPAN